MRPKVKREGEQEGEVFLFYYYKNEKHVDGGATHIHSPICLLNRVFLFDEQLFHIMGYITVSYVSLAGFSAIRKRTKFFVAVLPLVSHLSFFFPAGGFLSLCAV